VGVKHSFLFRLLRPEFVMSNAVPLCSDAFSMFLKYDPDAKQINADCRQATRRLFAEVIPSAAAHFDRFQKELHYLSVKV
jgi:hypothetical protein